MKSDIIREYLDKFPNIENRTLALKLSEDLPEVFPKVEEARTMVRYVRGANGAAKRKTAKKSHFTAEALRKYFAFDDGDHFDYQPYILKGERVLLLPDIHIPFHDKNAILTALEFGHKKDVDVIVLLGDLMDHYQNSSFIKDPRQRSFKYELDLTKQFLKELRDFFPGVRIVYKEGNHEERWERFLKTYAPQLLDLDEFRLDVILRLGELGIDYVRNKKIIHFGKLPILHGHEYGGKGSGGVNPARWLFLRTKDNGVCGHFHRISQHRERNVTGEQIGTWSMGCLCDLSPEYRPLNEWSHGFGYVEMIDTKGHFRMKNLEVENYKVI